MSKLRCLPYHRPVYLATTEYSDLILIPQDNPDVSPYVKIYDGVVESLMPEDLAPWPGATLEGRYKNEDEAVELILLGLQTWAQI